MHVGEAHRGRLATFLKGDCLFREVIHSCAESVLPLSVSLFIQQKAIIKKDVFILQFSFASGYAPCCCYREQHDLDTQLL